MQTIDHTPTTLQNCEDEAIHLIESVQSFGYVIAINPSTKKIQVVSENINDAGKLSIIDEDLRDAFWDVFTPPFKYEISPENVDFSQPWWL